MAPGISAPHPPLLHSVRSLVPVEGLVDEVEKRNKLKMLNPFLEQLVSEGSKARRGGAAEVVLTTPSCLRIPLRC